MMPTKNALEWTVFGISLALIALVVGVLTFDHATSDNRPPSIHVVVGQPERAGAGYAVPLDVYNAGDVTAEEVEVETLLAAGPKEERSSVTLAFVPRRASRRAWVIFTRDPSTGTLTTRVVGYREP